MQISFDPTVASELAIAAKIVDTLRTDGVMLTAQGSVTDIQAPGDDTDEAAPPVTITPDAPEVAEEETGNAPGTPNAAAIPTPPETPTSAPAAPTAPAASPSNEEVPTDARGVPWNEKVHGGRSAKAPAIDKAGNFKKRRGVDKAEVDAYEAPYIAAGNAPDAPAANVPAPPVTTPTPATPAAPVPTAPAAAPTPAPAAPTLTPADANTASGQDVVENAPSGPVTFATLMSKITGLQTAGHLTAEQTSAHLKTFGFESVKEVMSAPADMLAAIDAALPTGA